MDSLQVTFRIMRKTETYFRYLSHETGQTYKRCPLPMRINVQHILFT
jgi:hypothetical protein